MRKEEGERGEQETKRCRERKSSSREEKIGRETGNEILYVR